MSEFAGGQSADSDLSPSDVSGSGYLIRNQNSAESVIISLDDYPLINDSIDSASSLFSALRVFYDSSLEPYSPYNRLRCFITEINNKKIFVGAFDTDTGDVVPLIQIPIVGQTIDSLVSRLQETPGVVAQILNNRGFMSVNNLLASSHINATDVWAYFFVEEQSIYSLSESSLQSDIKILLTSVEPIIEQNNPSQSLGGYVSPTEIFDNTSLLYSVSFYDQVIKASSTALASYTYIQINDEIMEIDRWNANIAYIKNRQALDTPIRFHAQGSLIRGVVVNEVFDTRLSTSNKQYRCFAVKNNSSNEVAYDVKMYFKIKSRNILSRTRMCIEIPKSEYIQTTSQVGPNNTLIGVGLSGLYVDDYFKGASITFESGNNAEQTRVISNFVSNTGLIEIDSSMPYPFANGDSFYIDTSPSQRVKSGFVQPLTGENALADGRVVSDFFDAVFFDDAIGINFNNSRSSGADLRPNECVYVWLEREIFDTNEDFLDNRAVLSISYSRI